MRDKSIAELEGLTIDPGAYELGSQAWLSRALVSPIGQLGVADLRLLLTHGRGVDHLVPLALEKLEQAPFAMGEFGPGELLTATCLVDEGHWARHPADRQRLALILAGADAHLDALDARWRAYWREELDVAREHFALDCRPGDLAASNED